MSSSILQHPINGQFRAAVPLYTAYGLRIASDLRLPELHTLDPALRPLAESRPDVRVRLDAVAVAEPLRDDCACVRITPREACLRYDECRILVRDGNEIVIDPESGADERALRLYVLGPALAILLHQRGHLVLHASAVSVHGTAVAFVGEKGMGKSTTAAAFLHAGHAPLADDYIAIDHAPDGPTVAPGFPQLKLWRDAAEAFEAEPDALPQLHPDLDKFAKRIDSTFTARKFPLRRVYVLDDADAHGIESLPPQQAFTELVRHTYLSRLLPEMNQLAPHFAQVARLFPHVRVRRLARPRDLTITGRIVDAVLDDLAADSLQ